MNYGIPVQYVPQPVGYVVRSAPVQQIYAPYPQQQVVQPKQARSKSWIPLALLRLLLVLTLIGAVTAAAKIRNNDLGIKENKVDKSVWITTLVFSCVGLVTSLLILLAYLSQCVFLPGCRLVPWTILVSLFLRTFIQLHLRQSKLFCFLLIVWLIRSCMVRSYDCTRLILRKT